MTLRILLLLALLAPPPALAGLYESMLEQGLFYLERGPTYGSDAVRVLEKVRESDPIRAASDPKVISSLARAYALTSRFTEAYWMTEAWEGLTPGAPEVEALRGQLLGESGLGRVRVVSAFSIGRLVARLTPNGDQRLDVASRKALERLNELLARGIAAGPTGVTILAPEGLYELGWEGVQSLFRPTEVARLEIYAGDEVTVRLVPFYPRPEEWRVAPATRSVSLSWPAVPGASFELVRGARGMEGAAAAKAVYRGNDPRFVDSGLEVGSDFTYLLRILDGQGELLAASKVDARSLPAVSRVEAAAELGPDLTVGFEWKLGGGTADRVVVVKHGPGGEERLAEISDQGRLASGSLRDGPFVPAREAVPLSYRLEAWIEGSSTPAAVAESRIEVPPVVERVVEVVQRAEHKAVVVRWETEPANSIAQGYAIFRSEVDGTVSELVARVEDAFAREFEHVLEDDKDAARWRYSVLPYVGERYILDAARPRVTDVQPTISFSDRREKKGYALPHLALFWDEYPGAVEYAVVKDDNEWLVRKPYVEIERLQNPLVASDHQVRIYALDTDGNRVPLLSLKLSYEHYPRSAPEEGNH